MAPSTCHAAACRMPLHYVLNWNPFRIDALGIITMIGSEQIDSAVGRLVKSRYTEYLPLLGAFVLASDQFTDARSGFILYNISAGITTTDMAGWFERWCLAQDFSKGFSRVTWIIDPKPKNIATSRLDTLVALLISVIANGAFIALTILQGDWWGLANAAAMLTSVLVRAHVSEQNRDALDAAADRSQGSEESKLLVILSDAKMITMFAPSEVVKACFIEKPEPRHPRLYYTVRMIAWVGFTVQVIAIGMSGLATQIATVFIMLVPTVLTHFRFGCDDKVIGTRLRADRRESGMKRRQDVYVSLELEDFEEESMRQWNLMPHKNESPDSKKWWDEYNGKIAELKLRKSVLNQANNASQSQSES